MTLSQRFATTGQFLFRFRSYLPLTLFVGLACLFWQAVPANTGRSAYVWRTLAVCLTLAGVALRCATIGRIPQGTSGRNTKQQKASFLNTTGTYSIVRNPLYVGNALVWIGIALLLENMILTPVFTVIIFIYYVFVVYAEEQFLAGKFGNQYAAYAESTPALIPTFDRWVPANRPFSWRMVLRREHDGIFSAVTGIVIVFHCMSYRTHGGHFMFRREWAIPWLAIAGLWIFLKILKKKTQLLHVPRDIV